MWFIKGLFISTHPRNIVEILSNSVIRAAWWCVNGISMNTDSQIRVSYLCCRQLSTHTKAFITFVQSANKILHLSADGVLVHSGSKHYREFEFQFPIQSFSSTSRKERTKTVKTQNFWGVVSGIVNLLILFAENKIYASVNLMLHAQYYIGVSHI